MNRQTARFQNGITGAFATVDPADLNPSGAAQTGSPAVLLRAV
jgi:hypothetical protein